MGVIIAMPNGPTGGPRKFPGETVSELKRRDRMVDQFGQILGSEKSMAP
jgi:hypothetical protein